MFCRRSGRSISHTLEVEGYSEGLWLLDELPDFNFLNKTTRYIVAGDDVSVVLSSPDIWRVLYGALDNPLNHYRQERSRLNELSYEVTFIARRGDVEIGRATKNGNFVNKWTLGSEDAWPADGRLNRFVMKSESFKVPVGATNLAFIIKASDAETMLASEERLDNRQHALDGLRLNLKIEATIYGPMPLSIAEEVNPVAGMPLTLNYDNSRIRHVLKEWYPQKDIALGITWWDVRIDGDVEGKISYKVRFDGGPWSNEVELTRGHGAEMPIAPNRSWYAALNTSGFGELTAPQDARVMEIAFHLEPFMVAHYRDGYWSSNYDPNTNTTEHPVIFYEEGQRVDFGDVWDTPDLTGNSGWRFEIQPAG